MLAVYIILIFSRCPA